MVRVPQLFGVPDPPSEVIRLDSLWLRVATAPYPPKTLPAAIQIFYAVLRSKLK